MARSGTARSRWNGVAILARGCEPVETHRGLPGDPGDSQSRYIEAAVNGVLIGCLYLPNGNPGRRPKFDYKLEWFERLSRAPASWSGSIARSCSPATITSSRPTPTSTSPSAGWTTPCSSPSRARAIARLLDAGLDRRAPPPPSRTRRIFTFWDYWRNAFARNAGIRIDHLLLNPVAGEAAQGGGRRPRGARPGESQRPCAGLGDASPPLTSS